MALINGIYIFVEDENVNRAVDISSHPVESGIDISDTAKRKATTASLSGKIVNSPTGSASSVISRLEQLKNSGGLIKYVGRNVLDKMLITSFDTSHPNTVWGGAEFSIELQEVRIVGSAYVAPKIDESSVKNGGEQQVSQGEGNAVWYTVKKGDCVWNLVTKKYPQLSQYDTNGKKVESKNTMDTCKWVMQQNPDAFSRKGDFGTLQIGQKILLGYKN